VSRPSRLGFTPPQLPNLTDQPPEGSDWIHEVKHDGYRTMLVVERGSARTYTRNGHDWFCTSSGTFFCCSRRSLSSLAARLSHM
jgi:hypothetical protein